MKTFPSDNSKLAEMEFYLVDELECAEFTYGLARPLFDELASSGTSLSAPARTRGESREGEGVPGILPAAGGDEKEYARGISRRICRR